MNVSLVAQGPQVPVSSQEANQTSKTLLHSPYDINSAGYTIHSGETMGGLLVMPGLLRKLDKFSPGYAA
ncbi:hypothetical protein [Pseudomonas huanghezhanensis]|uniref:hypothetical protein n=1 Tax=Pseudomonas huanghezhanensis TaxID=3002903 RepID=UPI002285B264|nr:hypothetical protein [Pseudomonas sp. BSw22131]